MSDLNRVLIAEPIAERGLELLRSAGLEVDVQIGLSKEQLIAVLPGVAALVIRSATRVDADVLAAATDLVVVGRAGIGLDNVDVAEATRRGVMVVNAPQSNVLSAAEHSLALLLAQARNIPQAHADLVAGSWNRSRWEGVELYDKTLGIVGLGRVGVLVAQRANAFGMRLIAYDPFVSADRARQLGVSLVPTIEALVAEADFVTVHLPKTPETIGLIGAAVLAQAKPGLRIVNTARGGIVDEAALAAAIREGRVAGAAIDVFAHEPTTESPLFELDSVVVTPHLGASTAEAQDKAGNTIAEQVVLALGGDFVPFAVNVAASEASETLRPYLPLAERLGRMFTALAGALPETVVNAPQLAEERGVVVRSSSSASARDYVNLVTVRGVANGRPTHVAGTLYGKSDAPRFVGLDEHIVGTVLGEAGVNIDNMVVGRSPTGVAAMMAISTGLPVPAEVVAEVRSRPG